MAARTLEQDITEAFRVRGLDIDTYEYKHDPKAKLSVWTITVREK